MTNKPMFEHDSKCCVFLAHFSNSKFGPCDLYYCDQGGLGKTLIARFSDEPSDYSSGLHMYSDFFFVGAALAIKKGLISANEIGFFRNNFIDDAKVVAIGENIQSGLTTVHPQKEGDNVVGVEFVTTTITRSPYSIISKAQMEETC